MDKASTSDIAAMLYGDGPQSEIETGPSDVENSDVEEDVWLAAEAEAAAAAAGPAAAAAGAAPEAVAGAAPVAAAAPSAAVAAARAFAVAARASREAAPAAALAAPAAVISPEERAARAVAALATAAAAAAPTAATAAVAAPAAAAIAAARAPVAPVAPAASAGAASPQIRAASVAAAAAAAEAPVAKAAAAALAVVVVAATAAVATPAPAPAAQIQATKVVGEPLADSRRISAAKLGQKVAVPKRRSARRRLQAGAGGEVAQFGAEMAAGRAGALHASGSSSGSSSSSRISTAANSADSAMEIVSSTGAASALVGRKKKNSKGCKGKRKLNVGFAPSKQRDQACQVQAGPDRLLKQPGRKRVDIPGGKTASASRKKPGASQKKTRAEAGGENASIPAGKTSPASRRKKDASRKKKPPAEASTPHNSDGGGDVECVGVVRRVTETAGGSDSTDDGQSASLCLTLNAGKASIRRASKACSPTSCGTLNEAANATAIPAAGAGRSASSGPSVGGGSPSIGACGNSPNVGADGGGPSGVRADVSAGGSAARGGGGGAAVVRKAIVKTNATGNKVKGEKFTKKKKPAAAVKTPEEKRLGAFEKSMEPEPPCHAVVPETPTPWVYLPHNQGGPGGGAKVSTADIMGAMVWDREYFDFQPDGAMDVDIDGVGGDGAIDGEGGGGDSSGGGGSDGGGGVVGRAVGRGFGVGGLSGSAATHVSEGAPACASPTLFPAVPSSTPGGAAMGGGRATPVIRRGNRSAKMGVISGTGGTLPVGGLRIGGDDESGRRGTSVVGSVEVEGGHSGGGGVGGGEVEQGLAAPSRALPSLSWEQIKGKVRACGLSYNLLTEILF